MKLLLKLVIVAALANATWHLFTVYSADYKFRDAVEYAAESRGGKTDDQLKEQVLALAVEADLPIDADHLSVSHFESRTTVETAYTRPVEFFPGFAYPWTMNVHVDAYVKPSASRPSLDRK
jgi:hypothetical protein